MKKIVFPSLLFFATLFACGPNSEEAAKADTGSSNENYLQPLGEGEVQRQKEEDQQNLYKQELIDLRTQLVLETEKLKSIRNNQEITDQIKLIDSIKAETEKVSSMIK